MDLSSGKPWQGPQAFGDAHLLSERSTWPMANVTRIPLSVEKLFTFGSEALLLGRHWRGRAARRPCRCPHARNQLWWSRASRIAPRVTPRAKVEALDTKVGTE
jgi:hypothetical protein